VLAGADGTGQMTMTDTDEDRASRYFDSIAPRYDELISSVTRNIWVRDAFRSLVEETVAPGALLLDFGCGTGADALWYAERGYRVIAYDNCRAMIDQLRTKCAAAITRGEIIPCHAEYQAFLRLELRPRPVAIVSNFAVLSLISDLPTLFRSFAGHVARPGHVIVSVLNPFFWKDMRHAWWWRSYIGSLGKGMVHVDGEDIETYRYFPTKLFAIASPYFVKVDQASVGALARANTNRHPWSAPESLTERLERRFWKKHPFRNCGQFIFFVFQRFT